MQLLKKGKIYMGVIGKLIYVNFDQLEVYWLAGV